MRKKITSWFSVMLFWSLSLFAQQTQTILVQGVPRQVPLTQTKYSRAVTAATSTTPKIDASKVRYIVGTGDSISYLVIRWNDGLGMDNMVWGYRWQTGETPTGKTLIDSICAHDSRFAALYSTNQAGVFGGFGFDLNGSGDYKVLKGEEEIAPDSAGIVWTSGYAFDGYTAADSIDHWKSGWYTGYASYYVADNLDAAFKYSGKGFTGRKLNNNSIDLWSFASFKGTSAVTNSSYYFYVPSKGKGVYLPDSITIPLSDAAIVPAMYDSEGESVSDLSWTITENPAISSITSGSSLRPLGNVAFTGKSGELDATLSVKIGNGLYTSNVCHITITAPSKPITSIKYNPDTIQIGRNHTLSPTLKVTPTNATYKNITYKSSSQNVKVDSITGEIVTGSELGDAEIVAVYALDSTINDTLVVQVVPVYVSEIQMDSITMIVGDILLPQPTVLPSDADNTKVSYTIDDTSVASFYQKNIVAHKAGETTLTVKADDGQGAEKTVKLVVKENDHTPYGDYTEGTFILNEGWYGHDNGSMNYLIRGNEPQYLYRVYNRENADNTLGATGCYGMVYGGKLYVMSKQASSSDGKLVGGRLNVADATTLKQIAAFETIGGGDGRSAVGINPDKVYLGTSTGITVFDAKNNTVGESIKGTTGGKQIGDMVKVGKYVFAVQQSTGTLVIDAETDSLVKTLDNSSVQGVVESYDGNVWIASSKNLEQVNPVTLDIEQNIALPQGASITCAWGAWVSTPFVASTRSNELFWNGGGSSWSAGNNYYHYTIGQPADSIKVLFSVAGIEGSEAGKTQTPYGTLRYDGRTNELYVPMTQSGWGTNYEYNWMLIFDAATGQCVEKNPMKQYYWFPEMAIFPDKYAPEINTIPATLMLEDSTSYALDECVVDKDNLKVNIVKRVLNAGDGNVVNAYIENNVLKFVPKSAGSTTVTLYVESNGVVTTQDIAVTVTSNVGIENTYEASHGISVSGNVVTLKGYAGWNFRLYTVDGIEADNFTLTTNNATREIRQSGVLLLKGINGKQSVVKKISIR